MDKKGISGIVVTVLLVLLAIGAIGILWAVVLTFIKSGTEDVDIGSNIIGIEIVENSLKYLPDNSIELVVKRDSTSANISGIKIIVESETGQTYASNINLNIDPLEAKKINVPLTGNIDKISKVSAYPFLSSGTKTSVGKIPDSEPVGKGFISNQGLIGYWSFDNGAIDLSGYGNDGTINGAQLINGKIGNAYEFNRSESDYINLTEGPFFDVPGEITVSAWIYAYSAPSSSSEGRTVLSKYRYINLNNHLGWNFGPEWWDTGNYFHFRIFYGSGGHVRAFNTDFFSSANLNKWRHVVGTYKPSQYVRLYVDGVLVYEETNGVPSSISYLPNSPLVIGRRSGNPQSYFDGIIDEVRIYNRSLTSQEVYYLYKYN
ncbi:MAG: LamG domain-containing protein [Candidatus Pacearchaeota archaeon]